MKSKKLPIFLEITRNSFLIILLILATNTIVQVVTFGIFSDEYEAKILTDKYSEISSLSKHVNVGVSQEYFYKYLRDSIDDEDDEYIRIYSHDGIYYETSSSIWNDIKFSYTNNGIEINTKFLELERYVLITGPIKIGDLNATVQIIKEVDMFEDFIENSLPNLLVTLILGLILSALGAMYVSKNFINRLRKLTETMNEIKEKGLDRRVEISDINDEVDKVNIVFNSMMDDLEMAFEEQSRFVSDASHELKTPLTALQGHLSMLKRWGKNDKERLDKSIDICLNEVERLKKIVGDMLILSKFEKTKVDLCKIDEINPKIVVNEVIEQYKILNPNIKYTISIEEDTKIKIDENDLKQLLIIFIDNSIKYNNKENIEIQIIVEKINDQVKLEVKDNGIGIPSYEIENVTKRFYKVDKSRVNNNSFGIGLSISNRIIKNYNGRINIQSELDKYTIIKVYI